LISPSEKLALFRVVDAMIQTGLKFTQYKVDDGSFVFKLEPPGIENLITFGTESKTIRSRYAVRQLVSREMERVKIRRRKGGDLPNMELVADLDIAEVVEPRGKKREIDEVSQEKKKIVVERVKKDFFGRVITVEEQDDGKRRRTDSSSALKIQPDVWVRFHEGYSNAVRKPVVFAELLGRQ
jgi:chromosome transmission fidelity protein 18